MAIFKAPRITTDQRLNLTLGTSELVYDINQKAFYGGDGETLGGFPIGANAGFLVQRIELTQEDIDNKFVTLSSAPLSPSSVILIPEGGPPQAYGVDFIVVGNQLRWEGLGLDNFLDTTDVLLVQY
jgi:hypothetical protein